MSSTGLIFDIQRFSIHDGPGIRTTVFLKGCPLKCLWCSNPESQSSYPEIAYFKNKCLYCRRCLNECTQEALSFDSSKTLQVDRDLCNLCGKCVKKCPSGSLVLIGRSWTVSEVIDLVQRDVPFYRRSKGGITLSGGEPLMQPLFVSELLQVCKKICLHTVLQTTGCTDWEVIEMVRPYVDLFVYDLKSVDPMQHQLLTGQNNILIQTNLDRLLMSGNRLVIQIPIIPGYNDSISSLQRFGAFLKERKNFFEGINLIPYHRLGTEKYKSLGRKYSLMELQPVSAQVMEKIRDFFRSQGLTLVSFG